MRCISSCNSLSLHVVSFEGQGRYGTVWKASLADSEVVAVKVFSAASRCYYYSEREIYSLPLLQHPNIAAFLGCDQVSSSDGRDGVGLEYRLILEYAPFGCLQDYLRSNSIDWSTLAKMGRSVAGGLAFLHTDVQRGGSSSFIFFVLDSSTTLQLNELTC